MLKSIPHYVGGRLIEGRSDRTSSVFNPATGEVTGTVALASTVEVNEPAAIAKKAFPAWAATTPLRTYSQ